MEIKDYFIIGIAVIGWLWGVIQYVINRKLHKKDIILEKRYEVYSSFMHKMDEIALSMREAPMNILSKFNEFAAVLVKGDDKEMDDVLISFNSELLKFIEASIKPMHIINHEINKLKLIASKNLLDKIERYKQFINVYVDNINAAMQVVSNSKDIEKTAIALENVNKQEDYMGIIDLWKDIESLMRDEIGYYKK